MRRHLSIAFLVLAACGTKTETKYQQLPPQVVKLVPPQIDSFVASHEVVTAGDGVDLTATFENGTGAIDQGVGPVVSGTAVHVTPAATTSYQLTVSTPEGLRSFERVLVQVAAAPAAPQVAVRSAATVGQTIVASVAAQPGMTYSWSLTGADLLAGQGTSSVAFVAETVGSDQVSVIVTNAAGATATAMATVTVAAAPEAPRITVPAFAQVGAPITASIPAQDGATYSWSMENGTILAGGTSASITFNTAAAGNVHLAVVVTNAAGARASGSADLLALAAPADFNVFLDHKYASAGEEVVASVIPVAGVTYSWQVGAGGPTSGVLLSGQGTSEIRLRFADPGEGVVRCTETNVAGGANSGQNSYTFYPIAYRVTNENDSGPGSFRDGIDVANAAIGLVDMVYEASTPMYLHSPIRVTGKAYFHGPGSDKLFIDGLSQTRLLVVDGGDLQLDAVSLANGLAQGGDGGGNFAGGGGGAGMGGLILVKGGKLTLRAVALATGTARGGNGGAPTSAVDIESAGGGGGGSASFPGGVGTLAGDPGAGGLGAPLFPGEDGGAGGQTRSDVSVDGQPGGYGAGGGGAASFTIGLNTTNGNGGPGGFGAGGGGFANQQPGHPELPGTAGPGGTFGGAGDHLVGGGGGGLGGCIFIGAGELDIRDGVSFDGCTAMRGNGGTAGGTTAPNGQGKGGALFIADGANAHGRVTLRNNSASDAAGNGTDTQDVYGTLH